MAEAGPYAARAAWRRPLRRTGRARAGATCDRPA